MKFDCDIISDLLPLYKDGICSDTSKKIVEEHLAECPSCSKVLNMMEDTAIDEEIVKEKNEVIQSQAKFFKRKSAVAGFIIALLLLVPVSGTELRVSLPVDAAMMLLVMFMLSASGA